MISLVVKGIVHSKMKNTYIIFPEAYKHLEAMSIWGNNNK